MSKRKAEDIALRIQEKELEIEGYKFKLNRAELELKRLKESLVIFKNKSG